MLRAILTALMLLAGSLAPAMAGTVNEVNGIAIKGYDPVAYFKEGKPVPGMRDYAATVEGATFLFASAANRDLFLGDPGHYAPVIWRVLRLRPLQGLQGRHAAGGLHHRRRPALPELQPGRSATSGRRTSRATSPRLTGTGPR